MCTLETWRLNIKALAIALLLCSWVKETQLLQCLSQLKRMNDNGQIVVGQPDKILGSNLWWTSIAFRGGGGEGEILHSASYYKNWS